MMGATADTLQERQRAKVEEIKANRDRLEAAKVETAEANAAAAKARAEKASAKGPWTNASADVLNPGTSGGAGSAAGLVCIAGAIAFFGNMKVDKGFPKAGIRIITATILLAIIVSLFDNGKLSQPLRWLGYLMILSAAIRYVPGLSNNNSKGKKNG